MVLSFPSSVSSTSSWASEPDSGDRPSHPNARFLDPSVADGRPQHTVRTPFNGEISKNTKPDDRAVNPRGRIHRFPRSSFVPYSLAEPRTSADGLSLQRSQGYADRNGTWRHVEHPQGASGGLVGRRHHDVSVLAWDRRDGSRFGLSVHDAGVTHQDLQEGRDRGRHHLRRGVLPLLPNGEHLRGEPRHGDHRRRRRQGRHR